MTSPTKLRSVLEEAKQQLRNTIVAHQQEPPTTPSASETGNGFEPARSKLNTLLGRQSVPKRSLSVFQSVGVPQRPTYDLIADRVLGANLPPHRSFLDEASTYADHVAQRLRHLQQQMNTASMEDSGPEQESPFVGVEENGQPVWRAILHAQRGQVSHTLDESLAAPVEVMARQQSRVSHSVPAWPNRMEWSSQGTFKSWFVGEENFEATQHCEACIDSPVVRFNPLFIEAAPQSGCSLLLHATGQAWLRRSEGHVLHLTAADASSVALQSAAWNEALPGATALVVDDLHEFAQHEGWRHQLGLMLDHALNLGIQVLAGGRVSPTDLPASRLKEVLRTSTVVKLYAPTVPSLMAFARWRCAQKNLLMSDVHLAQLARLPPTGWRSVDQRLEQVRMAFDKGGVLLDHDDVVRWLEPSTDPEMVLKEEQRVEDVAAVLVGKALDSVYSSVEPGGIDLHAELTPWGEDDYNPPSWEQEGLASRQTEAFESALQATIDRVTPSKPSVLDVHERERFLLRDHNSMDLSDIERAVDVLVDLDDTIDHRMGRSEQVSTVTSSELYRLEERMVELAQRAVDADIEELISIADELRLLEERLVEVDPERKPLPPFEEDGPANRRRTALRRQSNPKATAPPSTAPSSTALDEYEPQGEWNIDEEGISANDLLEETVPSPKRVRLARLQPRTVLLGEEE